MSDSFNDIAATLPTSLPDVEQYGVRECEDCDAIHIAHIGADDVVISEIRLTPEEAWEFARQIAKVADNMAAKT